MWVGVQGGGTPPAVLPEQGLGSAPSPAPPCVRKMRGVSDHNITDNPFEAWTAVQPLLPAHCLLSVSGGPLASATGGCVASRQGSLGSVAARPRPSKVPEVFRGQCACASHVPLLRRQQACMLRAAANVLRSTGNVERGVLLRARSCST